MMGTANTEKDIKRIWRVSLLISGAETDPQLLKDIFEDGTTFEAAEE